MVRRWALRALLLVMMAQLAGHALQGERGLLAWAQQRARVAALQSELAQSAARREALEAVAARLREPTLDLDYVEERARALAGMAFPGDILVPAQALAQDARAAVDGRRARS